MTNKKAKNIGSQVYEGNALMNLLHDFWESGNGERLVALPSLNDNVPGLFDNYRPFIEDEDDDDPDDPDSLEISRIEDDGHSDQCEVISHSGLDLHFSDNE